ncbi:MAG: hypothetical protein P9M14_05590 [Candidatus Alcyoniella australis]|nr:hypothetical protein [Candidatus Alcyoniella australis]
MSVMNRNIASTLLLLLMIGVLLNVACMDQIGLENDDLEPPPKTMTGHAYLNDSDNHGTIKVELGDAGFSLLTDIQGAYTLPAEMGDGQWTLTARYPYYADALQTIEIIDGYPEEPLQDMLLTKQIELEVLTDRTSYGKHDEVLITLNVTNVSDQELVLGSDTSPATAYAVRIADQIAYGGLFPGTGNEPTSITLEAGETQSFEMSWQIDEFNLTGSDTQIEIFAVYCTSTTHPQYFDPQALEELNQSLYSRLTPTTIRIVYDNVPIQ